MAHSYAPRDFLRRTSNQLLTQYFQSQELPLSLDLTRLKETEVDPIMQALEGLSDRERACIDADFRLVTQVTNENGIRALIKEGRDWHQVDLEPVFEQMPGFHDKALYAFLHQRRCLEITARLCESDVLSQRYWTKRRDGVPAWEPRDDQEACADLAAAIGEHFRVKEGRGGACHVDVYRRDYAYYFFCYPEDYGDTVLEFEEGVLHPRPYHPAFEVVFKYAPKEGALDTYFEGRKPQRDPLEAIFGQIILGAELSPGQDARIYELDPLKQRGFEFIFPPASGIGEIRIREMRFYIKGDKEDRITLVVEASHRDAIYDAIDRVFDTPARPAPPGIKIPLALTSVTRVQLAAYFPVAEGKTEKRLFYVTFPNGCTLTHDGRDRVLREALALSGIERRPPRETEGSADSGGICSE
jgi:hypothetical protein